MTFKGKQEINIWSDEDGWLIDIFWDEMEQSEKSFVWKILTKLWLVCETKIGSNQLRSLLQCLAAREKNYHWSESSLPAPINHLFIKYSRVEGTYQWHHQATETRENIISTRHLLSQGPVTGLSTINQTGASLLYLHHLFSTIIIISSSSGQLLTSEQHQDGEVLFEVEWVP